MPNSHGVGLSRLPSGRLRRILTNAGGIGRDMGVEYSNINFTKALDKMLPHLDFDIVFVKLCYKFVSVDRRTEGYAVV